MSVNSNAAPVIIKRKKVVAGGGHHGGAWKVAYADFVTAMMAFFLLMWLLNATTEKQRKGLADYFNPTIPINRVSGGGEGALGGESVFSEKAVSQSGTGASAFAPTIEQQAAGQQGKDGAAKAEGAAKTDAPGVKDPETRRLEEIKSALQGFGGETMLTENLARHVVTRLTDEGLIVELFDIEGEPLFEGNGDTPTEVGEALAQVVAKVFGLVDNRVASQGYIRAMPEPLRVDPTWDQSAARAQKMRQMIQDQGLEGQRFLRVTGFADRVPAVRNPMAVRNNRVEVILLRSGRI